MVYPFPRPFPGPSILKSFSVLSLFSSGEQGAWYDPSDFLPNWRLNLLTRSEEFDNAAWSKPAGTTTINPNQATAPDGTMTADLVTATAGTACHYVYQANSASVSITATIFAKAGTANWLGFGSGYTNGAETAWFDLSTGTRGAVAAGGTSTMTDAGNGWWRCSHTRSSWTGGGILAFITNANNAATFNAAGTETIYIWGADLRLASNASVSPTYQKITDGIQDYFTYQPQPVMFTDAAGTTPVTAVEQPVGLLLDKSKGGRQSLAVTGWAKTSGDGTVTVDGNTITITGATTTTRVDIAAPGWAVGDYADMTVTGSVAGATGPTLFLGGGAAYSTLSGTNTFRNVISSSTLLRLQIATGSATYVVTSRGFVPGNHASQSTSASRPVLSARVNLLTYSEDFRNTAAAGETRPWLWQHLTAAATTETAPPSGLTTATKIVSTSSTQVNGYVAVLVSVPAGSKSFVYAKKGNTNFVSLYTFSGTAYTAWAVFNLNTGVVSSSASCTPDIENAGDGWYRCWFVNTSSATQYFYVIAKDADPAAQPYANGTWALGNYIYIAGADLRVTNVGVNLPAYQRVGAAVTGTTNPAVTGVPDYDTSGFPLYLKFDGTDDSLATGSIDFSATDKMSVFAGVRKLSDAATGMILELSSSLNGNPGTFYFLGPYSNGQTNYNFSSKGTLFAEATGAGFVAPITSVLTGTGDIIGDLVRLRSNGTQVASSVADQGAGNFGNYPLYIGRRGGSTLPYNGNLYSLIVRGALSTDAQIASTETYVNNLTKAY